MGEPLVKRRNDARRLQLAQDLAVIVDAFSLEGEQL